MYPFIPDEQSPIMLLQHGEEKTQTEMKQNMYR